MPDQRAPGNHSENIKTKTLVQQAYEQAGQEYITLWEFVVK